MELLSPAGNYQSFIAAINAGADAVYLGGKFFSARAYSSNFTNDEIRDMIKYAHRRNVKVYVTVNTIIFEDEFEKAVEFIKFLYLSDVDGVLLQDLGLAYYLHQVMPDLVIHASTQLNCHNLIMAKGLVNLGFKRIVLSREVSIEQIKEIKKLGVEVEVFVHGALCVSYSGNCLMSSFIGSRSGNRGKCAQPCRNQVKVVNENEERSNYALATKDLMTLEKIDQLIEAGVDSLKIEGRMKREEYVFQVVSSYRKGIDHLITNYKKEEDKIARLFNRKFTSGYIFNESRTKVLNQDTPSNLGVNLGKIVKKENNQVYLLLEDEVNINDGIKFLNRKLDGMTLSQIFIGNKKVEHACKGDVINFKVKNINLSIGTRVNKTTDYLLNSEIKSNIKNDKKVPVLLKFIARINQNLIIELKDDQNQIEYHSDFIIEKAVNQKTQIERIIAQLSKFDQDPYYYQKIDYEVDEDIFIPISLLNKARREALDLFNQKKDNYNHYQGKLFEYHSDFKLEKENITLFKTETQEQTDVIKDYSDNIFSLKKNNSSFEFLKRIDHLDQDKTKKYQMTSYYKECEDGGFYSYYGNVTNSYTLDLLFSKGYRLVFCSVECSKRQISLMNENFYKRHNFYPNLGVLVYGRIDYMILKSCPIASSYHLENDHCKLCKKNRYYLKDRMNVKFEIITNDDCTSRIISDKVISLTGKIDELEKMNIHSFMLDFTIENKKECLEALRCFKKKIPMSNKDYFGHFISEVQ